MVLTRWDPLFEIRRSNRLARRGGTGLNYGFEQNEWSIPLDIVRDGDLVTVTANIPGVDPENIDVTIEGEVLSIKAHLVGRCGFLKMLTPRMLSLDTKAEC
jgi:HSP20 family protein